MSESPSSGNNKKAWGDLEDILLKIICNYGGKSKDKELEYFHSVNYDAAVEIILTM